MERWNNKVAIVTGASVGIGAAIVVNLVENGIKVVGLARRKDVVEKMAKTLEGKPGKLYAYQTDMTKEEDILAAFKWTIENVGPIHILVNNAGTLKATNLIDGDTEKWRAVFDTNVLGLCIATREAVRNMRANDVSGQIIHINSITGHSNTYLPTINVYGATKHAVKNLTEMLRQELNTINSRIKISSISPGLVDTAILDDLTEGSKVLKATIDEALKLNPEDIAKAVEFVLGTPSHVQIHELIIKPLGEHF